VADRWLWIQRFSGTVAPSAGACRIITHALSQRQAKNRTVEGRKYLPGAGEDHRIAGGHLVHSALYRARAGAFSVVHTAGFGVPGRGASRDGETGHQQVKACAPPSAMLRRSGRQAD